MSYPIVSGTVEGSAEKIKAAMDRAIDRAMRDSIQTTLAQMKIGIKTGRLVGSLRTALMGAMAEFNATKEIYLDLNRVTRYAKYNIDALELETKLIANFKAAYGRELRAMGLSTV